MKACKKYISTFKLMWKQATDYRFEFIMEMVFTFIPILALYFLWREIYQGRSVIRGYSFKEMLSYMVMARFVILVITPDFVFDVMGEIQNGEIQHYICKPISYIKYWFVKSLGGKSRSALWSFISIIILCILFFRDSLYAISLINIVCFLVETLLAFVLYFEIAMIISLMSFWFYEISSWYYTLTFAIEFLAGGLFPLNLFPNNVQQVFNILPFKYLIYYPTELLVSGVNFRVFFRSTGILFVWMLFFYVIMTLVWRKGIKHYELIGG